MDARATLPPPAPTPRLTLEAAVDILVDGFVTVASQRTPLDPLKALAHYRAGHCPTPQQDEEARAIDWMLAVPPAGLAVNLLRVPRRLRRLARRAPYRVSADEAFDAVVAACAEMPRPGGWITPEIARMSGALHRLGHAHSIECWAGDRLVGGLYGVAIGGLFIGESIFTRTSNAGSLALIHLCARLRAGGFRYLDAQMASPQLARFGVAPLALESARRLTRQAQAVSADFHALDAAPEAGLAALLDASAGTSPAPCPDFTR